MLDINALPNDSQALKRLVIEQHSASRAKDIELREQQALIEHLRFQLAKLRRARFGQSSEQLEGAGQLAMSFEELKAAVREAERQAQAAGEIPAADTPKGKPVRRKKLPEHLERIDHVIEPKDCTCPDCGGALKTLGTDESEVLEAKTVTFTVTRHIRPKKRCTKCSAIVQAPAPSRPDREEFCRRLAPGAGSLVEVRVPSAPLSAVSDFRPCGPEVESYDAHAVGYGEQLAARSPGGGPGQACPVGIEPQRR